VEDIRPEEIREGNLKAILGLFFQLSRYKQQQKQQQLAGGGRSSVPSSPAKYSNIPVPGQSPKRCPSGTAVNKTGGGDQGSSLRGPLVFGKAAAAAGGKVEEQQQQQTTPVGGLRTPGGRTLVAANSQEPQQMAGRQSMLERLRIVKTGGSSSGLTSLPQHSTAPTPSRPGLGKRTSSSSGFSSARSDRSESSISLSSDTNFPSPSALRRIQENQQSIQAGCGPAAAADQTATRRLGIRNKFSRSSPVAKEKSASPKRSPKLGRSSGGGGGGGVTEIKDYGPIDEGRGDTNRPTHYPPHAYSR
jgi:neuron navigator 2